MELRDNNTRKLTSGLRRPFGVAGNSCLFVLAGLKIGPCTPNRAAAAVGREKKNLLIPFWVVSSPGAAQGAAQGSDVSHVLGFEAGGTLTHILSLEGS